MKIPYGVADFHRIGTRQRADGEERSLPPLQNEVSYISRSEPEQ